MQASGTRRTRGGTRGGLLVPLVELANFYPYCKRAAYPYEYVNCAWTAAACLTNDKRGGLTWLGLTWA